LDSKSLNPSAFDQKMSLFLSIETISATIMAILAIGAVDFLAFRYLMIYREMCIEYVNSTNSQEEKYIGERITSLYRNARPASFEIQ